MTSHLISLLTVTVFLTHVSFTIDHHVLGLAEVISSPNSIFLKSSPKPCFSAI